MFNLDGCCQDIFLDDLSATIHTGNLMCHGGFQISDKGWIFSLGEDHALTFSLFGL